MNDSGPTNEIVKLVLLTLVTLGQAANIYLNLESAKTVETIQHSVNGGQR